MNLGSDWGSYLRFRDEFAQALDLARHPLEWLDHQVWTGEFLVWANDRACILCEIETYPSGARDIHGMLAAGELEDIVQRLIPDAEDYAREIGCLGAKIESRPGWAKVLKDYGYNPRQTMLAKSLEG